MTSTHITLSSAQLRAATEEMVHAIRGIEPQSTDDVTVKDFLKSSGFVACFRKRIRLGQIAATFSLAAERPVLFSQNPKFPTQKGVRLHATASLRRAAEHLKLQKKKAPAVSAI